MFGDVPSFCPVVGFPDRYSVARSLRTAHRLNELFFGEGVANIDVTGRTTREDDEVTLLASFSQRERDILLAGILRHLREK